MEKVTTISNLNVDKSLCRYINGKYYLIGQIDVENSGDVFEINNRFIRLETNRLIFNITSNKYELKNQTLATEGYVYYNKQEQKFIKGYFEFNDLYDNILITEQGEKINVFSKCYIPYSYRFYKKNNTYCHISKHKAASFNTLFNVAKQLKESYPYNSEGHTDKVRNTFEANYKPLYNEYVKDVNTLVGNLTFGFEFETTNGIIPNNKLKSLPLLPLRDGSISGLEYVTIPLQGEKGIQALIDSSNQLQKNTTYDSSCALHLHIGNIPRTPEFILALFKLYALFTEEMYQMFPYYKYDNLNIKRKNYSEPYDLVTLLGGMDNIIKTKEQVNTNFSILFNYLSESERTGITFKGVGFNLDNVQNHPKDPNNTAKWNINHRYHIINFIPLIFVNKATVEFRIHTPTFDSNKIVNFLIINSLIVNEAMNNTQEILNDFHRYIARNYGINRQGKLYHFILNKINNSKLKYRGRFEDELSSYINNRKDFSRSNFIRGRFNYDEDSIQYGKYINYDSKLYPVKKKACLPTYTEENDDKLILKNSYNHSEIHKYYDIKVENINIGNIDDITDNITEEIPLPPIYNKDIHKQIESQIKESNFDAFNKKSEATSWK